MLTLFDPDDGHAIAIIRWPNFDSFKAWRTQAIHSEDGVVGLHARAQWESVCFLSLLED